MAEANFDAILDEWKKYRKFEQTTISTTEQACESYLERQLLQMLRRCSGSVLKRIHAQYPALRYRIDFVCETHGGRLIGLEADGSAYHDPTKDRVRDGQILASGCVDVIYRIPYGAIEFFPDATMAALAYWDHAFDWRHQRVTWVKFSSTDLYSCETTNDTAVQRCSMYDNMALVGPDSTVDQTNDKVPSHHRRYWITRMSKDTVR